MAQDGNSQEQEQLAKVEEKLGKLNTEKVAWRRDEAEREAKVRRQHSLEQAAGIVKTGIDWSPGVVVDSKLAGQIALELADKFYGWVETGELAGTSRSSITQIPRLEMGKLHRWLERPNGSLSLPGVTLESVEDGGILIRVR